MLKRIRDLLGGRRRKKKIGVTADAPVPSAPTVHRGPNVVHRPIARTDLDPDAVKIIHRLSRFDHSAYFVGGCVRDLLLERKPKDFDIGTSATPGQIKRLFRNCRIIGRRFRLAHIYFQNGKIIEVATFRALDPPDEGDSESESEDLMIRDDNVFGTPEEDALRRDFTINSLFYDLRDETVLDHADGLGDLRRKLVRCIGDPEVRFREDPIRSLRAIKFAARLGFVIEKATLRAMEKTRGEIGKAAAPRILEEINRMCRGGAARRSFELLIETGILGIILPEICGKDREAGDRLGLSLEALERMDSTRFGSGREIRTGEILAVLLLPVLAPEAGWKRNGKTEPTRAVDLRGMIDDRLRPIALRLRVPRREQEHCRQILGTLFRLVPGRNMRRNTKAAILRRECIPDAMWMLEVVAPHYGEEFAGALGFWKRAVERRPAGAAPAERQKPGQRPEGGRRRPRRRRGGRRRSGGSEARERRPVAEAQAKRDPKETKRDLPPVWDDDYFFAALPEAPDSPSEKGDSMRYGGSAVIGRGSGDDDETTPERPAEPEAKGSAEIESATAATGTVETEKAPRPKRRRRRRRRRKPASAEPLEAATKERTGGSEEDPTES
jgi:poly(A) polymerase